jgi:hypothetical protein
MILARELPTAPAPGFGVLLGAALLLLALLALYAMRATPSPRLDVRVVREATAQASAPKAPAAGGSTVTRAVSAPPEAGPAAAAGLARAASAGPPSVLPVRRFVTRRAETAVSRGRRTRPAASRDEPVVDDLQEDAAAAGMTARTRPGPTRGA